MSTRVYGTAPTLRGLADIQFEEYMHFMYLPIVIPEGPGEPVIPDQLGFARSLIEEIVWMERSVERNRSSHVYVTARRGYATPGNPLNRPGWHSDGFGTDDINYVWTDRYPTLFAIQEFRDISDDHIESARQFEEQVKSESVTTYPDRMLMRLTPSVIHAAPEIPAPGGERSFLKVSFSNDRYNLRGNSHNHLLRYDWPMHDRASVRNDPAHASADGKEEEA